MCLSNKLPEGLFIGFKKVGWEDEIKFRLPWCSFKGNRYIKFNQWYTDINTTPIEMSRDSYEPGFHIYASCPNFQTHLCLYSDITAYGLQMGLPVVVAKKICVLKKLCGSQWNNITKEMEPLDFQVDIDELKNTIKNWKGLKNDSKSSKIRAKSTR